MRTKVITAALAALLLAAGGSAGAKVLRYRAALDGAHAPTQTGSKATGEAQIRVDTDAQTVDFALEVKGLAIEDLSSGLLKAPMGPIHLHVYGGHDHSNPDSAALMFPAPYGPAYAPTPAGFRVDLKAAPYADGAKRVNSKASFDDFVGALQGGRIVVNVHTNRNADGEISGDVVPAV